jgi:putative transposase
MKQTHEYRRDGHRVHLIIYHLIWCPRRRKLVLVGPVAARCRALIAGKCAERGWDMLALATQADHVHLVVRVRPGDSAADVVKECKGITSFISARSFRTCSNSRPPGHAVTSRQQRAT